MRMLHLQVSPNRETSYSREISNYFVQALREKGISVEEEVLDLSEVNIPHLDHETIISFFTGENERTLSQKNAIVLSDRLVDDLVRNDIILISTPIWNFSLPSSLKAWIDHVTRVGKTFGFGPDGQKVGTLKNKRAVVVAASGGLFSKGAYAELDFFPQLIKTMLSFIGIDDFEYIRVEGTSNPKLKEKGLLQAKEAVNTLVKSMS